MIDYRITACSVCGDVRRSLVGILAHQRMRDGTDKPEYYGDLTVWVIDMCDSCRKDYEESMMPPEDAGGEQ